MTNIEFKSSDADFLNGELEIVRIARGVFGISGYIEIKQPVDETSSMEASFYRDKYCDGNYEIQAYSVSNTDFPAAMNNIYKDYIMESLKECAENEPVFETFVPPLTKRCIVFDSCQISTDNLPSHVDDGCYWLSMSLHGQVEASIEIYGVVEKKDL